MSGVTQLHKVSNPYTVLNGEAYSEIVTSVASVPVTVQRKPYIQPEDEIAIDDIGTARANIAATHQKPNGTTEDGWDFRYKDHTVLQQHLDFFDTDSDGIIWPHNTFVGFYRLGFGLIISFLALLVIHVNFSYPTVSGLLPDPFFRIYIERCHKTKHGSDSGTYDTEGRFSPQKFEDIFSKYSSDGRDYLTWDDIKDMLKGQRLYADPIGWSAAFLEWAATYYMVWPADGKLKKEDVRAMFDGSLFYRIAEKRNGRPSRDKLH